MPKGNKGSSKDRAPNAILSEDYYNARPAAKPKKKLKPKPKPKPAEEEDKPQWNWRTRVEYKDELHGGRSSLGQPTLPNPQPWEKL